MANSQRVANFSADKARFFSSSAYKPLAQIRNEVRYKYAVKVESPGDLLERNTLYIESIKTGLQYTFLDVFGQRRTGQVDSSLSAPMTAEQLRPLAAGILKTIETKEQPAFQFLAENRLLIEQEYQTLSAALERPGNDSEAIIKYAYYCCFMLESYYSEDAYSVPGQAKKYHNKRKALENKLQGISEQQDSKASAGEKITDGIYDLFNSINHTTDLRSWLSFFNMYRLLFVFSRLSVRQSLLLAQELHWLDALSWIIGRQIDADAMIRMINAPAGIFNALSVQIFVLRFLLIVGEGLKHVLAPTEKEQSLSWIDRFKQELFDRHCDMLNDLTWGVVNLFSNYPQMFNLSAPVANWLTAGFLFFDVSMLLYRRFLSKCDYKIKKEQLTQELLNAEADPTLVDQQHHLKMLREQINQLELDWEVTSAYLLFNTAAAALLMGGYSAALLLTGPAAVAASFVACSLAAAMYLSAGEYKSYKEKSILLVQERKDAEAMGGNLLSVDNPAVVAKQEALYHLMNTLVKNAVLPMVVVTLFAVNWPAALLVTTLYVTHECLASNKSKKTADWLLSDSQDEADQDAPLIAATVS